MPHLETGKRYFCKGVKWAKCIVCGKEFECPTNKKVPVCFSYICSEEMEKRKRKRDNIRAKKLREKEKEKCTEKK